MRTGRILFITVDSIDLTPVYESIISYIRNPNYPSHETLIDAAGRTAYSLYVDWMTMMIEDIFSISEYTARVSKTDKNVMAHLNGLYHDEYMPYIREAIGTLTYNKDYVTYSAPIANEFLIAGMGIHTFILREVLDE